jgi:hypothetical protein
MVTDPLLLIGIFMIGAAVGAFLVKLRLRRVVQSLLVEQLEEATLR